MSLYPIKTNGPFTVVRYSHKEFWIDCDSSNITDDYLLVLQQTRMGYKEGDNTVSLTFEEINDLIKTLIDIRESYGQEAKDYRKAKEEKNKGKSYRGKARGR